MNRKKFIEYLKIGNVIFSANDLKACLIEQMLEFIERRIAFFELIELAELIKTRYLPRASGEVIEVVNGLHRVNKTVNNPIKKLTEEEIIFMVDDLLIFLTDIGTKK